MIIEPTGFLNPKRKQKILDKIPTHCKIMLNLMCYHDLPFQDVLNYFESQHLNDLIMKVSKYRLNSFEFVIQVYLWKKKEKAVKNYESNCVKEEQLNYILKLYDSHAIRKSLKRVVEELELAEKVEEELEQEMKEEQKVEQEMKEKEEQKVEQEVEETGGKKQESKATEEEVGKK